MSVQNSMFELATLPECFNSHSFYNMQWVVDHLVFLILINKVIERWPLKIAFPMFISYSE